MERINKKMNVGGQKAGLTLNVPMTETDLSDSNKPFHEQMNVLFNVQCDLKPSIPDYYT